jgi:hypothetical protein
MIKRFLFIVAMRHLPVFDHEKHRADNSINIGKDCLHFQDIIKFTWCPYVVDKLYFPDKQGLPVEKVMFSFRANRAKMKPQSYRNGGRVYEADQHHRPVL